MSSLAAAAPARERGNLTARVMDEDGQPLADILVSFLQKSATEKLPFLTRSNDAGLISLKNLAAGSYGILVRSSRFRTFRGSDAQVTPGRTEFVNVILQQILGVEVSEEENLSPEDLLRATARNRVILRTQPGRIGDGREDIWSSRRAVLSFSTNPGLGGDYLVFPSDSAGGSVTNFAVENPLGLKGTSVLAGQLSSGKDSIWRLKNFANLSLSDRHALQIFMGYGRLSFNQPRLGLVDAPLQVGGTTELSQVSGPLSSLTFGMSDSWQLGESISVRWGLEVNRIRSAENRTFASPDAEVTYSPFKGTELRFLSSAKRTTQGNTLELPSGGHVNISDAVYISRLGEELRLGTARYRQASLRQKLGGHGQVEVAAFSNQVRGAGQPFALKALNQPGVEVLQLQDSQGNTSGYRVTYRRQFDENLKGAVTYIYGSAVGMEAASEFSLERREVLPDL
ncbi:MAG: carboxypeptidase-like regulatory domain-containing protein, partial [Acidobacteriota bacterium]